MCGIILYIVFHKHCIHVVDNFHVNIYESVKFTSRLYIVNLHHNIFKASPIAGHLGCFQFFAPISGSSPYLETCLNYDLGANLEVWLCKVVA